MKKAQGISINTIIVAAIALIVLVVLIAIFTGRLGDFNIGLDKISGNLKKNCEDLSEDREYRVISYDDCMEIGGRVLKSKDAPGPDPVCCTKYQ